MQYFLISKNTNRAVNCIISKVKMFSSLEFLSLFSHKILYIANSSFYHQFSKLLHIYMYKHTSEKCSSCTFLVYDKMNLTFFVVLKKLKMYHIKAPWEQWLWLFSSLLFPQCGHKTGTNFVKWTTEVAILWQRNSIEKQALLKESFFYKWVSSSGILTVQIFS